MFARCASWACLALAAIQMARPTTGLSIDIPGEGGRPSPIPSRLHGLVFEETEHAGDGGIYAQLLENNGFQGSEPGLTAWSPLNRNARISQDFGNPLTTAITSTLRIAVPAGATGRTGVVNRAYEGFQVTDATWRCSFYVKGAFEGQMLIQLAPADNSAPAHGSARFNVRSNVTAFTKVDVDIQATGSPGADVWKLSFDASLVAGRSVNIGYPTLFPPTWKGRENGLIPRFANALNDLKPGFLRFPSGQNMLGLEPKSRWKWNETIGPLINRPGRDGAVHYYPETGGLMEYFDWCEDMDTSPILVIWSGSTAGGFDPVVGDALEPYIDDALAELEFILGDATTPGGALRSSYGRPEPYKLHFVELGSGYEDKLGDGCRTYPERSLRFYTAIKRAYPKMEIIANVADKGCLSTPLPEGLMLDYQTYTTADDLVDKYNLFNQEFYSSKHGVVIGGFARRGIDYTTLRAACAEAIFMFGWEKHPAIVRMGSYPTPLSRLGEPSSNDAPPMITFTPTDIIYSAQYYVMKIVGSFTGQRGEQLDSSAKPGPVYWAASSSFIEPVTTHYLKLANYQAESAQLSITIPGTECQLWRILGTPNAANTPETPNAITLRNETIVAGSNGRYEFDMIPYGVANLVCT